MGGDAADFLNAGASGIAVTNFDIEMVALYTASGAGTLRDGPSSLNAHRAAANAGAECARQRRAG
jgi:hypothetical protein